ncbi:MAG: hypothetical protein O2954_16940 [bacterium]|nr:hypothetical protein [bacterium]
MSFFLRCGDNSRRPVVILVAFGLVAHMAMGLAATLWPEQGDAGTYKIWANEVSRQGLHMAYHFGFDQLPLYLYVSKLVTLVFFDTGLSHSLGPYSRVLTMLLKVPMVLFNLLIGLLVYRLTLRLFESQRGALVACAAWTLNPAILLATAGFGYPDALPALVAFLVVYAACMGFNAWVPAWTVLVLASKPQAWPVLGPAWLFLFCRQKHWLGFQAVATGVLTLCVLLFPFWATGELDGVIQMYAGISRVHSWMTGCAHNFWGMLLPSPPFLSDRDPLLFGVSGMVLGLVMFGGVAVATLVRMMRQSTASTLVHLCAFLVFAFFMLMTEIHENHIYPMFPFLAVCAGISRVLRRLFIGLTLTFGVNLVLTAWLMQGPEAHLLPVILLVSRFNALVNVGMFVFWSYFALVRSPHLEAQDS